MIHIKEFIISREEPTDTTVGWLKPIEDGKYSIYFYGSKGWCSVVDETSGGGSSAGEVIDTNTLSPLNLNTTYAEELAIISGYVDVASKNQYGVVGLWSTHYGGMQTNAYTYANIDNVEDLFDSISIQSDVGNQIPEGSMMNLTSEELADVYKVSGIGFGAVYKHYDNDGNFTGYISDADAPLKLAVKTGWPRISTISEATKDDVEYVLCIDSNNKLKKVPVSLFTQE